MYYFFSVSSKWPWPWQNVGGHHEHDMRYVYTKYKHFRLRCLKGIIENRNLPKNFNLMYYFFYISSKWPWPKVGGHHEHAMRYVYIKYKHYRLRCLKGIIENCNLPKNINHVLFLLHKFKMTLTLTKGWWTSCIWLWGICIPRINIIGIDADARVTRIAPFILPIVELKSITFIVAVLVHCTYPQLDLSTYEISWWTFHTFSSY